MKSINERPIGIFDSGIGGLTVFREIEKLLPHEHLIYFGDTARVPYGTKSAETVKRYSFQIARFLNKKKIKMLVVACNTASAYSLKDLQKRFSFPVSGVIVAGVKAALESTRNGKIVVIGTEGTIQSSSYRKALMKNIPAGIRNKGSIRYIGKPCPLFVPLVEEGWVSGSITVQIARKYLSFIKSHNCDTLILGCTHYPLLKGIISKIVGPRVKIIDSAEQTARIVRDVLLNKSIERKSKRKGTREFCVTDSPERFCQVGKLFLGKNITRIRQVRFDTFDSA